jgi:hypothetical protein
MLHCCAEKIRSDLWAPSGNVPLLNARDIKRGRLFAVAAPFDLQARQVTVQSCYR